MRTPAWHDHGSIGRLLITVCLCNTAGAQAPPFDVGLAPTQTLHIAMSGSNATGDGSVSLPFATLAHAAARATPGTAVELAPGSYPGGTFLTDLAGQSNAPIWIRGSDPTNRPVITGAGEGLHLSRTRWLVLEHLEVAGSASNGINADDGGDVADAEASRGLVFRNLYIHDVGGSGNQDGLKLSGIRDFWVLDCEITRCGGDGAGSGIDMVGCHRGVVTRCRLHTLSANAVQCKGGTTDIDIMACDIRDAGHRGINIGGSTGTAFFRPPLSTINTNAEARAIRVRANRFRGSDTPVAFVGCTGCLVAHNTIVNPSAWLLRILQETVTTPTYPFAACGENRFINNLVYFTRADLRSTDINVGPNTDPASFQFAHNLWYAHDAPAASAPALPATETNGIAGLDPLLANPAAGDFGITLDSPAARGGGGGVAPTLDATGQPFLNPPSIGAHEFTGDLDGDTLPDAWEWLHFGGTNLTNGGAGDADTDGAADYAEWVAGTDPQDSASRLALTHIAAQSDGSAALGWTAVPGRMYTLYGRTNVNVADATPLAALQAAAHHHAFTTAPTPSATARYFHVEVTAP